MINQADYDINVTLQHFYNLCALYKKKRGESIIFFGGTCV